MMLTVAKLLIITATMTCVSPFSQRAYFCILTVTDYPYA